MRNVKKVINKYIIDNDLEFIESRSLFLVLDFLKYGVSSINRKIQSKDSKQLFMQVYDYHKVIIHRLLKMLNPELDDTEISIKCINFLNFLTSFNENKFNKDFKIRTKRLNDILLSENNLILLYGVPCSGKSTVVSKLEQKYNNIHIFSNDTNRILFTKEKLGEVKDYNYSFNYTSQNKKEFSRYNNEKLKEILNKDGNIIIDNTNCFYQARKNIFRNLKRSNINKICIYVDTNLDIIKKRNKKRFEETGKFISDDVLNRFLYGKTPLFEDEIDYYYIWKGDFLNE